MGKKINIAVIGPGRMGRNYAISIQQNPDSKLIAICGNSVETTQKNGGDLGVPLYYNNAYEEMLERHPEIDTVLISSSEWSHMAPFLAAVKANKNIILEKPVAIIEDDILKMEQLASENPHLFFFVCFTCRFDARYAVAKNMLDQGMPGNISYIYTRRNASGQAYERVKGRVPFPYWIAVHDIDLIQWYVGSEIVSVSASLVEDEKNGALMVANLFFKNGSLALIECCAWGKSTIGSDLNRMDIHGEKGKIELKLASQQVSCYLQDGQIATTDENDFVDIHGTYTGSTPTMINHFVQAIKTNNKAADNFMDGISAVRISQALCKSIETQSRIDIV